MHSPIQLCGTIIHNVSIVLQGSTILRVSNLCWYVVGSWSGILIVIIERHVVNANSKTVTMFIVSILAWYHSWSLPNLTLSALSPFVLSEVALACIYNILYIMLLANSLSSSYLCGAFCGRIGNFISPRPQDFGTTTPISHRERWNTKTHIRFPLRSTRVLLSCAIS